MEGEKAWKMFTYEDVKQIVAKLDSVGTALVEVEHNETSRVVRLKGSYSEWADKNKSTQRLELDANGDIVVKFDVYYTTGKVKTALNHPTKGKTQLFRGYDGFEVNGMKKHTLTKILHNPRAHTGGGWYKKEQREMLEKQAANQDPQNNADEDISESMEKLSVQAPLPPLWLTNPETTSQPLTEAALRRHDRAMGTMDIRRQFNCAKHGTFWKKVADNNKPVARCRQCSRSIKLKAIPVDEERGFGTFKCGSCGDEWTSVRSCRGHQQACAKCGAWVPPLIITVVPMWKRKQKQRLRQNAMPSISEGTTYTASTGGGGDGFSGGGGGGGSVSGGGGSGGSVSGGSVSGRSVDGGSSSGDGATRSESLDNKPSHKCTGCATGACSKPPPTSQIHHSTGSTISVVSGRTWATFNTTGSRSSRASRSSTGSRQRNRGTNKVAASKTSNPSSGGTSNSFVKVDTVSLASTTSLQSGISSGTATTQGYVNVESASVASTASIGGQSNASKASSASKATKGNKTSRSRRT